MARAAVRTLRWFLAPLVLLVGWGTSTAANLGPHATDALNPCRACHNTAAGIPALRGWAGTGAGPASGTWSAKAISNLCYMCHQGGGGGFNATNQSANAYADSSHSFVIADIPEGPAGVRLTFPVTGSGLPYVTTPQLECTSCHNVHLTTNRPYSIRPTVEELCDACHPRRINGTAIPARSTTLAGDARPYSTHPTGQPLGDQNRANVKDLTGIAANLKIAVSPVWSAAPADAWSLGGHLDAGATGNLTCQTCHAVHGPAPGISGLYNLLAIENDTLPNASTPSALCEGCHFGGDAGEQVGADPATLQSALPAGSWSDHPIDNANNGNRPFYPTGTVIPNNWQGGNLNNDSGATALYGPVATAKPTCQSCHDTHGGIENTPLLRGPQPSGAWAPFSYNDWCFACHTAAQVLPVGHHSVINNHAVALGNAFDSQLSCGDCHGPAGTTNWGVHNGFWTWSVPVAAADSAFCEACHSPTDPTDLVVPSLLNKGHNLAEPADFPATHGTPRGTASHYLGPDSGEFAGVDPKTSAWPGTGYFSSYGPPNAGGGGDVAPLSAGEIICESCHNIVYNDGQKNPGNYTSPLAAGWESNLLLERYEDDLPGTGGGTGPYAVGSALCTGCHDRTVGNHHPLTGDVVPLSGLVLRTGPGSFADQASAPSGGGAAPGTLSYPLINQLDCDSCHRPHRADDDSDVAGAAHGSGTSVDGRPTRHILEVDGAGHRSIDLCRECHAR